MEYVHNILALFAGLGAFLLGVKLLSDNTEKLATNGIKNLFNKASKSKIVGVGIGTSITMIVQSSSLTTVMVVGFVNAGVMSLIQATTIIMGANIGTTITAQIAALEAFDVAIWASALSAVGIFITMFFKKDRVKTVGLALAGLGVIFIGLSLMSNAMSFVEESEAVREFLKSINHPLLLFFIGVALTAVLQSSSAVTAILITMAASGAIIGEGGNAMLFIILGTNIGTCITALLSSIGTSTNAKRAAIIHLLFNVLGSLIYLIILLAWKDFMAVTFETWFPGNASTQIAMFHTFFNISCTLLFLPFSALFVKAATFLVRENKKNAPKEQTLLDKRFLPTPGVALESATKEAASILDESIESLKLSVDDFVNMNDTNHEKVVQINDDLSHKAHQIIAYLIQISSAEVTIEMEKQISSLHASIGDITRISDLAINITKYTKHSLKKSLHFSATVKDEIKSMFGKLEELAQKSKDTLINQNTLFMDEINTLEDSIDEQRKKLIKDHIARLNKGECKAESSSVFINLVCNLERVGDHLTYIAETVEEPSVKI